MKAIKDKPPTSKAALILANEQLLAQIALLRAAADQRKGGKGKGQRGRGKDKRADYDESSSSSDASKRPPPHSMSRRCSDEYGRSLRRVVMSRARTARCVPRARACTHWTGALLILDTLVFQACAKVGAPAGGACCSACHLTRDEFQAGDIDQRSSGRRVRLFHANTIGPRGWHAWVFLQNMCYHENVRGGWTGSSCSGCGVLRHSSTIQYHSEDE